MTLEDKIDSLYFQLVTARTPQQRHKIWKEYIALINLRSEETVKYLELKKGLNVG